jgi:HAD superfamily phosphatase (TIGR01668 family)
MILEKYLIPDVIFNDIYEITPEFLTSEGIKGLVLDIDNTLVPYEIPEPTEEVRAWLSSMWENGIKTAFVSNNHKERVELFNQSLNCPAFYDSGKPLKKSCSRAMEAMEVTKNETAIIGDQVFTDVLAGRISGLNTAILVNPIKDKTNLFFKSKRLLEKPVLAAYRRREAKKAKNKEG